MKKILLFFCFIAIAIAGKAQGTCATAVSFSSTNTCNTGNALSGSEMWFKFTADSSSVIIEASKTGGTAYLNKIYVYSGTCAGLSLKDSSTSYIDSTVSITVTGLSSGAQYYIKVVKGGSGTSNFDLCMYNSLFTPSCVNSCNGQVANGSFETYTPGSGSSALDPFTLNKVQCWFKAGGTPQIGSGGGGSSGSTYFAHMYTSGTANAEAIYSKVNIVSGHTYAVHYFIRRAAITALVVDNFYIKLALSTGGGWSPSGSMAVMTPTVAQTVAHNTNITNGTWAEYTTCFTATAAFDRIYVHPERVTGAAQQWLDIDEIQITELTVNAGSDLALSCTGSGTIGTASCTPIPGVTYSWSPTAGLASPASASTTVNPVYSNTNYTVTATAGGCSVTDVVNVSTSSGTCSGTLVISTANGNTNYSVNTIISTTPTAINDDVTILSGITTITSDDVRILTGKKITIRANATLIVDGAWLHACNPCGGMWYGIVMEAGSHLQIINSSVIEDATNAVLTTATGSVPDYTINNAIFNKNATAVKVEANSNSMSSNVIKNTIITCRSLPAPTAAASFAANFSTIKTALQTNTTLSLSPYPTTLTLLNLRSETGVKLTDISNTGAYLKVGDPTSVSGNGNLSIFDNLDYGIFLTNSMCDAKNISFQNMPGNQSFCIGCTNYPTGVAIFAPAQTVQLYNKAIIGGSVNIYDQNKMIDCFRGVDMSNYLNVTITDNLMVCSTTPSSLVTSPTIARNAVYLKNIKEEVTVSGNTISNWLTGILHNRNNVSGGVLNPAIKMDNNGIGADVSVSGSCIQAISITDLSTNTITTTTTILVHDNSIYDVDNGIKATYIKNNLIAYNNYIAMRYKTGTIYGGIWIENCDKAEIKNNEIFSLRGTYGDTDNWDLRGIYVKTSINNKVYCNTLYSLGQCMAFYGACSSSTLSGYGILSNYMDNARTGILLTTSAVIGQQGSSTSPSGNTWNNSYTFHDGRTYTYNTTNANTLSVLYCSTGGATYPPAATNMTNGSSGTEYNTLGGGLVSATGSAISCPTTEIPAMVLFHSNMRSETITDETALAAETKPAMALLYPNPNTGKMTLEYELQQNEKGIFIIHDLTGKRVAFYKLNSNATKLQIDDLQLQPGIYLYEVVVNDHTIITDKLVILK